MTFQFDEGGGSKVGSHIRLSGRILDISLFLDAVVTQRTPPTFKVWETCSEPQLLVIGRYRMGFELTPEPEGTLLRVFLHYALPSKWPFRWLSSIFGLTQIGARDAWWRTVNHFAAQSKQPVT